jgi:hypothetical protein
MPRSEDIIINVRVPSCLSFAALIGATALLFSSVHAATASALVSPTGGPPKGAVTNAIPATGVTWYPVEAANITRVTTSDPGHAVGWAVDPDAPYSAISVRATVTFWTWGCVSWMYNACYQQGEVPVYSASSVRTANMWDSDLVGTIYGADHAFNITFPSNYGGYSSNLETVQVIALNVGVGSDTVIAAANVVGPS